MALGAPYYSSTFIGVNVFVIDAGDEATNILLTNNDLRNTPTVFPVSNTDRKASLMFWPRPTLVRPLIFEVLKSPAIRFDGAGMLAAR